MRSRGTRVRNFLTYHLASVGSRSNKTLEASVRDLQTKSSVSAPKQRLVELAQRVNFGTIENLIVRNGEPVFDPAPRVIRSIRIGGENGPRPELALADFTLREPVVELFDHLSRIGNGTVESIQVRHGMPCQIIVEQPLE
jgi:hypothetical protein